MADEIPQTGWSTPSQSAAPPAASEAVSSSAPPQPIGQAGVPKSGWSTPVAPPSHVAVPTGGWNSPGTTAHAGNPAPEPTPHAYDNYIESAARGAGIDAKLLQAVGVQESGLGTSPNFDPSTGRDRDGNKGAGIFQLDPSSNATAQEISRAAKDPKYAAQRAAQMLSGYIKDNHGDVRAALAQYNTGSATSQVGLAYAASVLDHEERDQPLIEQRTTMQKIKHDAATVRKAVKKGKPLGQALAHTDTFRPLHNLEVSAAQTWDWARKHTATAVLNTLGAGQHGLGGFEYDAAHHPILRDKDGKLIPYDSADFKLKLQHVMDYVLNPTEQNNAHSTAGAGDVINAFAQMHGHKGNIVPTHTQIDQYVRGQARTPAALKPYEAGLLKAGSDFGQQTISDPLYLGELGKGLVNIGLHVTGSTALAAHAMSSAMGIAEHMSHLPLIHEATEGIKDVFVARRDLDRAGLTERGKQIRIAIENRMMNAANAGHARVQAAKNDPQQIMREYLKTVYDHGSAKKSAEAARLLHLPPRANGPQTSFFPLNLAPPTGTVRAGTINDVLREIHNAKPDDRAAIVTRLHSQAVRAFANKETKRVFGNNRAMFTGNVAELDKLSLQDDSGFMRGLQAVEKHNPLTKLASLGKKAILWNPIPHGLVNVGTLAYQAGGIEGVMRGFSHMIHGVVDRSVVPANLDRLEKGGGMRSYADTATSAVGKASNALLERMEVGWRSGLLDQLDRKLGSSAPGSAEEYLKMAMINNHVGDYRNISAFVQMFKSLGGPFVAFRLGIVPEQFAKTLAEHPSRIVSQARGEEDIQENREGKNRNQLEFGGSLADALKLYIDPKKFFASPSTSGALGEFLAGQDRASGGLLDWGLDLANAYVPGLSSLGDIYQVAEGATMPGQKMSLADQLAAVIEEEMLNIHYSAQQKGKSVHSETKSVEKQVTI